MSIKLRPIGKIDFLNTKGQIEESCYYYTEKDFIETIKFENNYGVPMIINVFRNKYGKTIPIDFVKNLDPIPHGLNIIDYKEGEDINDYRRLQKITKIIKKDNMKY